MSALSSACSSSCWAFLHRARWTLACSSYKSIYKVHLMYNHTILHWEFIRSDGCILTYSILCLFLVGLDFYLKFIYQILKSVNCLLVLLRLQSKTISALIYQLDNEQFRCSCLLHTWNVSSFTFLSYLRTPLVASAPRFCSASSSFSSSRTWRRYQCSKENIHMFHVLVWANTYVPWIPVFGVVSSHPSLLRFLLHPNDSAGLWLWPPGSSSFVPGVHWCPALSWALLTSLQPCRKARAEISEWAQSETFTPGAFVLEPGALSPLVWFV